MGRTLAQRGDVVEMTNEEMTNEEMTNDKMTK
jgi:hypothetical protein